MELTLRELLSRALDHARHRPSRAAELAQLRERFRRAPEPSRLSSEQVERARRLRELREELAAAHGAVTSCTSCSRGQPLPEGRWEGGFCCAGRTEDVFDDVEVAALKAAGIDGRRLMAPTGDHAGCAFRGPTGCSLHPTQRANRCVRHVCSTLRRELGRRGRLARIQALGDEIEATLTAFAADLERQRRDDEWRRLEARLLRDWCRDGAERA